MAINPHILLVEARFYDDIADQLAEGAIKRLEAAGATYERIEVPGALEVPTAIHMAESSADFIGAHRRYDGYVALGCVIRGETYHFEIVCNESARMLQDLAVKHNIAIGNGILTVENREQAEARSRMDRKDKGGDAAQAALDMINLKRQLGFSS